MAGVVPSAASAMALPLPPGAPAEAAGKMVSVLQDMTQTVIDMVQPVST